MNTMIAIAPTEAAGDAAVDFSARTGTCVQAALQAAGLFHYCACPGCLEAGAAEAAAEIWAEGAWLRAAENAGEPCRGIMTADGGCACC